MEKYKNAIFTALIVSEASHVFCCVLPTVFSVLALLSGLGFISALPAGWATFHDAMHHYEIPMIIVSALILVGGWWLYYYSEKIDCHDTGCCHGPCAPQKSKTRVFLKIATILFVVNLLIYGVFHRGMGVTPGGGHDHAAHEHAHED
ncbi:MAG: hypothetical protein WBK77_01985 [Alphaproteobacteria bacterium]